MTSLPFALQVIAFAPLLVAILAGLVPMRGWRTRWRVAWIVAWIAMAWAMTVAAVDVFIFNASIDAMKPSMGEAYLVAYADVLMSHRPLRWLALGGGWLVPLLGFGLGQGLVALESMRRRAAQA